MVRLIEVINLRLKLLDALPAVRARQFKTACHRTARTAIHAEKIPERAEAGKSEDEQRPAPLLVANRVNQHPELKTSHRQEPQKVRPMVHAQKLRNQGTAHARRLVKAAKRRNHSFGSFIISMPRRNGFLREKAGWKSRGISPNTRLGTARKDLAGRHRRSEDRKSVV